MEASQQAMQYINTLIDNINALAVSSDHEEQTKKQVVNQLITIHKYLSAVIETLKKYGKE